MASAELSQRRIFSVWWPLAASWLLMSAEMPALTAFVARLANPEINLAAYAGVVFPIALIVESPIIMLLAASTALSKDWATYIKLRRFMMVSGALLTLLHAIVAFTPLYDQIVRHLLNSPEEIIEPARIGLRIMLPWTWSIAYRRFHQGVLIRFGHSRSISTGTLVRLATNLLVLGTGFTLRLPGIVVAASAVAAGVFTEAVFIGVVVRPVLKNELRAAPPVTPALTLGGFMAFYFPLVMTSLISLLLNPIGSAALGRLPLALDSLATWPAVGGLTFAIRSLGIAFNEVVVALLDEPKSYHALRRFSINLMLVTTAILLMVVATPLARFWFETVTALAHRLSDMAQIAVWVLLPMPALAVLQSWFQGALLYSRRTRAITESVIFSMLIFAVFLYAGVVWGRMTGLYVAMIALLANALAQTGWLWLRSQPAFRQMRARDADDVTRLDKAPEY